MNFLNKLIIFIFIVICSVGQAYSHSVQVQWCVSCDGDLRIWLEHWHGSEDPNTTTMTISITINGNTSTITSSPGGGVMDLTPSELTGCSTPITYATGCPFEENMYNDWVYYDFPGLPTNVPLSFTIISGNTQFTEDCCSPCMYPLTVNFAINTFGSLVDQNICLGSSTNPVIMDNTATWTNSNPSIGLPASGTGSIPSFTPIGPPGSTATITFANSCDTGSFNFAVVPNPLTSLVDQNICSGSSTNFVSMDNTATWTNSNPSIGLPASGTGSIPSFTPIGPPGSTATINVSKDGCTGSFDLTIIGSSSGTTTLTECNSFVWDGVTYNSSGAYTNTYVNSVGCDSLHTLNLTIIDSSSGSTTLTACNSFIWDGVTYNSSGTYTNTYFNSVGCDSLHTLNLTVLPQLNIISSESDYNGFNISCHGYSDGAIDLSIIGGNGSYSYLWSNGSTIEDLTSLSSGFYSIDVTAPNTCPASKSIMLTEPPPIIVNSNILNDTCNSAKLELIVDGGISPYNYLWSDNQITPELNNLIGGNYSVTISDDNNCDISEEFYVDSTLFLAPNAEFNVLPNFNIHRFDKPIFFQSVADFPEIKKWFWEFGDGFSSVDQSFTHTFSDIGEFDVSLIVENLYGCVDTTTKRIIIKDFLLYIPNSFTPQGDGVNDIFAPKGIGISDYELKIYNRYGEHFFTSDDLAIGWDGTNKLNNKIAQIGVYIYSIYIIDVFGQEHSYTGKVTLVQ